MSTVPIGPFAPDIADHNVGVSVVADNCVAIANGFRKLTGDTISGVVTNMTAFNSGQLPSVSAHRRFVVGEGSGYGEWLTFLSGMDAGGANWELWAESAAHPSTEIGNGGGSYASGDPWPLTRPAFVDWDTELFIFGQITPQKISDANVVAALNDGGTTTTSAVSGSPPFARYAARVRQQLVLGYTNESAVNYPHRLWWSAFGNPEGWTSGTNLAGFEDDAFADGGDITGVIGGEYGLVFQQRRITRMDFVGAPDVWQLDDIENAEGSYAPDSIVQVGSNVYYLAPTGFRIIKDGSTSESIGASLVDEWFKGVAGDEASYEDWAYWVRGAYDQVSGCIFWAFRDTASSGNDGENNRLIIFNTQVPPERAWSTATPNSARPIVALYSVEPQGEGDGEPLREFGLGVAYYSAGAVSDSKWIGEGNLAATIETGHVFTEGKKTYISRARANIDGAHTLALLTKADTLQDTEVDNGPVTPDAYGYCNFDIEARFARMEIVTTSTWEKISSIEVDQAPAGEY